MKASQKRVKKIIESLQHYMDTYDKQLGYLDYSDKTIIEDILYGLGTAIDKKKFSFAPGFDLFKVQLRQHLSGDSPKASLPDRTHEECTECIKEATNPPLCHGHAAGETSCQDFEPLPKI